MRYWSEYAWLGEPGPGPRPGSCIEVEGGRIAGVRPAWPIRRAGAVRLRRAHPARPGQRPLARLPPGAARAHPRRQGHVLDLAGADVRPGRPARPGHATTRWPGPPSPRWRWPASPASASSTTCTTGRAARRYDDPNEMGHRLVAAAAEAGIRITLLDTLYLTSGVDGAPLAGPQLRFGDGDVDGWAAAGRRRSSRPPTRVDRRGRPLGAGGAGGRPGRAGRAGRGPCRCTCTCPSSGPRTRPAWRATGGRRPSCWPTPGCIGADGDRRPRHPPHRRRPDPARRHRHRASACARPPSGTSPTASGRPGRWPTPARPLCLGSDSHAVIDLFEEARAVELDERLRDEQRGHFDAGELLGAATAAGHAALGWPDAGRLAPGARADLVTVGLDTVRTAGYDPSDVAAGVVFAAERRRRPPRGGGRPGRRPRRACTSSSATSPRALRDAVGAVWSMSARCVARHRRAGHQRPDAGRRLGAGVAPRRRAGRRATAGWPGSARSTRRRPPTGWSTPRTARSSPGFVDSHAHLVFAGDRAAEFAARMAGEPYTGGGIRTTVAATRAASDDELARHRGPPARRGAAPGHHHHRDQERVRADHVPTRRGRCASPASSPPRPRSSAPTSCRPSTRAGADDYVDLVCGEMLAAAAPHARWVDVFCERGAFDVDQSRAVLEAGIAAGLRPRIHANQLTAGPRGPARGRARRGQRRPLHPPVRRRRRGAGRVVHRGHAAARGGVLHPVALPGRAPAARRRRHGGAGHRLQPRLVVHVLDAVLHRAGRPRDAHDPGRGAVVGHRRRGAGAAPRRTSVTSASAPGPTSPILDAPSYLHLAYRPGVPLVRTVLLNGEPT